jgi:protein-S-isoprenylcysteine O-methyltransferase Ste14
MAQPQPVDAPGVVAFPPLIFAAILALELFCHTIVQVELSPPFKFRVAGSILAIVAGATALSAALTMRRAGTNINPARPALAIVTAGPYRFTRNPMYLALCLLNLGIGLLLCDLIPVLLTLALFLVLHYGVILREERYLEKKFGPAYTSYKARVRRWL